MSMRIGIRVVIAAALIVLALLAVRLHVAGGQPAMRETADVARGRHLAEAWCTECHAIERATARTGTIAPDFVAIAQRRATTEFSLKAFLNSEHKTMPNFIIEPPEAADLAAYIMSLKRR